MTKKQRRPVLILAAVLMVGCLSITAFAYGGELVQHLYSMMSGGSIEQGVDADGNHYTSGTAGFDDAPVERREDGKLYFVADGQNIDITGACSNETPYIYECTDGDNVRHVLIVGGDPDAIGYAEFLWDAEGNPVGGSSTFAPGVDPDDVPWMDAAREKLNLPW